MKVAKYQTHSLPKSMGTNGVKAHAPSLPPIDYVENGRLYHGFRRGIYMYPCDEQEKDRLDILHQLFGVARRAELHRAPLENSKDVRILDLGCGTGIWAIDIAERYPAAQVVGVDLSSIQPAKIPRNLSFQVPSDYEDPHVNFGESMWDLIHLRQACGSIYSWPAIYEKIFRHLKPGEGFLEQVEIDLQPRCDDETKTDYYPPQQWYNYLVDATRRSGRSIEYRHDTRQMLEAQGFIDIQEQVIRAPFNSWPKDPHQKEIGRWYCVAGTDSIETLSLAPFTRMYQWSTSDFKALTDNVKRSIAPRTYHYYNNIHIWIARRPQT